jgi:N6-L-threonylcarbamoyladenine synthase
MREKPEYPFICSVVSGGHTLLLLVKSEFEIIKLGSTVDDAIGEAFDKVSKMIGLGYPGGPLIQESAKLGDEKSYLFPVGKGKSKYDFSFSGLKTAVLRMLQKENSKNDLTLEIKNNIAAAFQAAAVKAIIERVNLALKEFNVKSISLVGGVAANQRLRDEFMGLGQKYGVNVVIPDLEYCGDNAAMIAYRGMQFHTAGKTFSLNSNAFPTLPLNSFANRNET